MASEEAAPKPADPVDWREEGAGQAVRLNELILEVLRDHIVDGVLADGLVLRERDVSEAFGVDRAPVALALRKLLAEGLIRKRGGRGWLVARNPHPTEPVVQNLRSAGLSVPMRVRLALARRTWRQHIYPEIERTVASCLAFGRFRINQSALADHYGVSRTVAHEVLTTLERVGLVRHESNNRWYAGPMSVNDLKEFYELRLLLEPEALRQAMPFITRGELELARRNLIAAQALARPDAATLNALETELHTNLILKCPNAQMRRVLARCQLPIVVSYGTVARYTENTHLVSGIPETLADHRQVVELMLAGRIDDAAAALHAHITRGMRFSLPHFAAPPPLPAEQIPAYMTRVGRAR